MHDIRVAFRQFRKSPGFVLTIIFTIALGIGANTAIFTLVHAVLMKSLPVVDPKTLYRIGDKDDCCVNGGFMNDDGDFDLFSYDLYCICAIRRRSSSNWRRCNPAATPWRCGAVRSLPSRSVPNTYREITFRPSESERTWDAP